MLSTPYPSSLPGARTNYSSVYGGKPLVPSPTSTASTAIAGNTSNLPGARNLGTGVNQYLEDSLITNYNMAIPNYSDLASQSSQNIDAQLHGQLPQDVLDQIIQAGAERGVSTGSPGSANQEAAILRALGLNSLDMTRMGEANLSGAVARSPIAQPFDISRLFVTPEQEQEAQALSNVYASAPNPAAAGKHMEALARGGGAAESVPWYVSAAERAALGSPGGAHYDPVFGNWMGSSRTGVF